MSDQLDAWVNEYKDGVEIKPFLAERLREGLPSLEPGMAERLAAEICDTIDESEAMQREIATSAKSRARRIQEAITAFSTACNQKREDVSRAVLECLNQTNHAYLERVAGEKADPISLADAPQKTERNFAEACDTGASLMESTAALQEGEACDNALHGEDGKERVFDEKLPAHPFVENALKSDNLSVEENVLKKLLAGNTYVEMRQERDFKGNPMYVAVRDSSMTVARIKALVREELARERAMQNAQAKNLSDEECEAYSEAAGAAERKKSVGWMQAVYETVFIVSVKRFLKSPGEWLGRNILSVPTAISLSPIFIFLEQLGIPAFEHNRQVFGWIGKHLGAALYQPLRTVARKTWPVVKETAKTAVEVVRKGALAVAQGVNKAVTFVRETAQSFAQSCANGVKWLVEHPSVPAKLFLKILRAG